MNKKETIPVQIEAEKLCIHTLKITNNLNNFPKKYRFTLVDRILTLTFDIHDGIVKANAARGTDRIEYQEEVLASCTALKFYIRMVHEVLKPDCSIPYWDSLVDKIESQIRNWKTSTKKYADDFYLIHESKEYLKYCVACMKEFLQTLHLELNPKSQLIPVKNGISFLGFHFYIRENGIEIRLDNGKQRAYRRKFNRMIKKVKDGSLNYKKLRRSLDSWETHARYCTDHKIFEYYEKKMKEVKG